MTVTMLLEVLASTYAIDVSHLSAQDITHPQRLASAIERCIKKQSSQALAIDDSLSPAWKGDENDVARKMKARESAYATGTSKLYRVIGIRYSDDLFRSGRCTTRGFRTLSMALQSEG